MFTSKSRLIVPCLAVVAASLLAGCGDKASEGKTADNADVKKQASGTEGTSSNTTDASAKKLVIGFAQIGAESDWRKAETQSVKDEAAKQGIELKFSDAQQKQENEIKAIRAFIAQKVDGIILAPVVETGFEPVLKEAAAAHIPVVLSDRAVSVSDDTLYATLIGSDFVEEGRKAARFLVDAMHGKGNIVELQGTPGSAPAIDRKKGFEEILKDHPDMKIIESQTGEFTRAKGKEVMEAFLKSHPREINALYAHNDDMGLGAIQAIEEAGLKPGKDILVVSIDGVHKAFEALIAGKLNCTVECNPLLGEPIFDAMKKAIKGEKMEKKIVMHDDSFTQDAAAKAIGSRKY